MLSDNVSLLEALAATRERGYAFEDDGLLATAQSALKAEAEQLSLESIDQDTVPIRAKTVSEVRQRLARACAAPGDPSFATAAALAATMAAAIKEIAPQLPELAGWSATELCYQLYRDSSERVSPHRDPKTYQLLGVTITIAGMTRIRIFEPLGAPNDYTKLRPADEYIARPGSMMFLRSTGFGTGERIIHEALPPEHGSRLILNLRLR